MSQVAARLLRPLRASLASSFSGSKPPGFVRAQSCVKGLEAGRLGPHISSQAGIFVRRLFDLGNSCRRGWKVGLGSAFGASLTVGVVAFRPRVTYSFDDELEAMAGAEDAEDDRKVFQKVTRRIWLPVFFIIITVFANMDHPMMLALKIILLLLSSKPSPLSVYLFIEQMYSCSDSAFQEPGISILECSRANKVEVRDYKLLCLAQVEMRNAEKLTLVGILGSWWKLPFSHGNTAFLVLK